MIQTNRKKVLLKVAVMVDAGDGEQFAYMFVPPGLDVGEVLNDERAFLQFERVDGTVAMIGKKFIRSVVPIDSGRAIDPMDPYDVLGITASASDVEVQEAYRRAVSGVHPDRFLSLGLPAEFMELATRRTARLNDAYGKVKALRQGQRQAA
ncbi:J domain-containing protein [Dongia deserti]|uniref:J domain-containing protein n=1 Tax=Dongia deserti TaxID=2268030 RepID=UPI000E65395C|nr:DnaJ domain-containing protein [Dongia deserti]